MNRRELLSLAACATTAATAVRGNEPEPGADGLYDQPFFLDSFLELGDDLVAAAAEGKGLIVIFEQNGCPYCRELHRVNFQRDEITGALEQGFHVVQLDLWGARTVRDFDGEELEERDLAQKWFVNFTPTQVIFPAERAGATSVQAAEAFRMPGYFKPFHHLAGLDYVLTGAWKDQPFQRFLQDRFAEFQAKGIDPDVW